MKTKAPTTRLLPVLLTEADLSVVLQVPRRAVRRLVARGCLPLPARLGARSRWRSDELRAWLLAGMPDQARWQALKAERRARKAGRP